MKSNWLILTVLVAGCSLLSQAGCEEQAMAPQERNSDWFRQQTSGVMAPSVNNSIRRGTPRITFERVVHDFGRIGPESSNICEFKFTNTGSGFLKITEVDKTCGCTPFELAKAEYAPGESGILKVGYYSDKQSGEATKQLFVYSNDEARPKIALTIKASILATVDYGPKKLDLSLREKNAGCSEITLVSLDGQPFSITSFKSTADCITADYNPSIRATRFVLQPKVDVERLKQVLRGRIEIGISHPQCNTVTTSFSMLPRFKANPRSIMVHEATPNASTIRKIRILNNYEEDFEIESVSSRKGAIKVLSQERLLNGYELELKITPPATKGKSRVFTDMFLVNIKGAERLEIACSGFYAEQAASSKTSQTSAKDEDCPTCGLRTIDFNNLVKSPGGQ
jgi:hypothetical protein